MNAPASRICQVHRLGLIPYLQAWRLQDRMAAEIASGLRPASLLLLEHPHAYTFGRRGKDVHLLWSEPQRKARDIEVHWVDRGGDVTYHGPGQLVGYPLIALGVIDASAPSPAVDYVGYLRQLEECLIRALDSINLPAVRMPGMTGVWIEPHIASLTPTSPAAAREHPSKIAALGVKVDPHGITRHGFALNVHPDMSYWEGIVACGLAHHPNISLADLLDPCPSIEDMQAAMIESFGSVFGYQMR